MTDEKIVAVVGDQELEHHDLSEAQQRFLRARWLVANLGEDDVRRAVEEQRLEPDADKFVRETAQLIASIEDGDADPEDLLPVVSDRLEDAFMWTRPFVQLSKEQKLQVVGWCRRDGHAELADEIEVGMKEEKDG